jgi:ectoine hydroxylase-related dioxygenase (phytanoyl-CoA dioxygenase family)
MTTQSPDSAPLLSAAQIASFRRDGALVVRGAFADWIDTIAQGIADTVREPGPYAAENLPAGAPGRFFDDYCNWTRIPAIEQVVRRSPAARLAAEAMGSHEAQFFHDHVLVKDAGTAMATPWHQDSPYYFVEGEQTVSMWIPVDPVREATLRMIAGSHRWSRPVLPVRWATDADFYADGGDYLPVPDPDTDASLHVLEWALEPGDAVLFDYRTVHGARGNPAGLPRRVLSLRWLGDDARYVERPGRTSPPYPGHAMVAGQRLRTDWFPIIPF